MSQIKLEKVTKKFGQVVAVDEMDITIEEGALFTLLGPSGCGKTTTLRIVGGFEQPDKGEVYLGGERVTDFPPSERDTSMVFQNYAIWPHKTVFENVAYGLRIRRWPKREIKVKVAQVLKLVGLTGYEKRHPGQLSGGQQQRVALARSLAIEPSVLLMDEPLGNLDAKLRKEMRIEIRHLQQDLGTTMIWVTHDQEEALAISDQLAVMQDGRILQVDAPSIIYKRPNTRFVAEFLFGANIFECTVESIAENGTVVLLTTNGLQLKGRIDQKKQALTKGDNVLASVNPAFIHLGNKQKGYKEQQIVGTVKTATFTGAFAEYHLSAKSGDQFMTRTPLTMHKQIYQRGDEVKLLIKEEDVNLLTEH